MTLAEWASAISGVFVAIAAGVGAYVAWKGLSAWREQLRGGSQHDLARRILVGLYKHRDAIADVRNPLMTTGEGRSANPQGDSTPTLEESEFERLATAYERRWEGVTQARQDLYPDLLEAEVYWGKDAVKLVRPCFRMAAKLRIAIQHELRNRNPKASKADRRYYEGKEAERMGILYAGGTTDEPDQFAADYQKAFEPAEQFFKEKLVK